MNKTNTYIFDNLTIYFKHTDYHGKVHPYNFFEWTGYVRENFFVNNSDDFKLILNSPIAMMTTKIELKLGAPATFGDTLQALFNVDKIKRVSFDVLIKFVSKISGACFAETCHTLVFINTVTGKFAPIPHSIKNSIEKFAVNNTV